MPEPIYLPARFCGHQTTALAYCPDCEQNMPLGECVIDYVARRITCRACPAVLALADKIKANREARKVADGRTYSL